MSLRLKKDKRPIIDYVANKYTTFNGIPVNRDKYTMCYVPYTEQELLSSKTGKTHHMQLVAKRNLEIVK